MSPSLADGAAGVGSTGDESLGRGAVVADALEAPSISGEVAAEDGGGAWRICGAAAAGAGALAPAGLG